MKHNYMQTRGLKCGFPRGTNAPSAVKIMRPNADGVLAPIPLEVQFNEAVAAQTSEKRRTPTHSELNTINCARDFAIESAKEQGQ